MSDICKKIMVLYIILNSINCKRSLNNVDDPQNSEYWLRNIIVDYAYPNKKTFCWSPCVSTYVDSNLLGITTSVTANSVSISYLEPNGVAMDITGNLYSSTNFFNLIRKISSGKVITTLAGSGSSGNLDGTGTSASFNNPFGIAMDNSGNVYVADSNNHKIRKITTSGAVTTLAGSGSSGNIDATGTSASFSYPNGVAVDTFNNIYVADTTNSKIRKITSSGVVTTLAGSGFTGSIDATGTSASFNNPSGIAVDNLGNLYVADTNNHKIRKINSSGVVTTMAGSGSAGNVDASGTSSSFNNPFGIAVDNLGNVYVADTNNHKIRKITTSGVVSTIAGSGLPGNTEGTGISAFFNKPNGIVVDASGTIFVADSKNYSIRKIVQ